MLKPAAFHAAIAKRLPGIVFIAGEEPLLVQEALDATRAAAKAQGYSERSVLTVEPGFRWQQLFDECNSLSLFASLRLIELHLPKGPNGHKRGGDDEAKPGKKADGEKSEDGTKLLVQLAERPPQDVCLVVVAGEIDYKARSAAWVQALEAAGAALYAEAVAPAALPGWIGERAAALKLKLAPEAVTLLAERTEGNLLACSQDLAKLALLHPGEPISGEILLASVADSSRFEAFDLVEKMLRGDAIGAIHALDRLREEGATVPELIGALAYALRSWAQAVAAMARTSDINAALAQAKLFGIRARPYEAALKRGRGFAPAAGLRQLAQADVMVKTGRESAAWEELLTLVLAASGAKAAARAA